MDNMDIFELKNKLIEIMDLLEKQTSEMMAPACDDEDTAQLRAKVYRRLRNVHTELFDIMYHIY